MWVTLMLLVAAANLGQCITMGALLNQSLFLILMGIMKGKTVALIVQDFRNVSVAQMVKGSTASNIWVLGTFRPHLRLIQGVAHRQFLLDYLLSSRASNHFPQLLWSVVEHIPLARRCSFIDNPTEITLHA